MPVRTEYAHGTPSWTDLATTDPDAAREFYGALFGWSFEENPTDQGSPYIMASKGGHSAAGMMQQPAEQAQMGIPPMWNSYVTVDDLDGTVAKVEPAGGSVMAPPMDVMDAGRMAVAVDPSGGVICMWEPGEHIGAQVVNEHGALTWTELISTDVEAANGFYEQVFGWDTEPMDMPEGPPYNMYTSHGDGVAGAMPPPMDGMPSFWGVYFAVDDCDACVATAKELGATVLAEPMDIMPGRMSTLQDPQGAVFSVIALAEPPS